MDHYKFFQLEVLCRKLIYVCVQLLSRNINITYTCIHDYVSVRGSLENTCTNSLIMFCMNNLALGKAHSDFNDIKRIYR